MSAPDRMEEALAKAYALRKFGGFLHRLSPASGRGREGSELD